MRGHGVRGHKHEHTHQPTSSTRKFGVSVRSALAYQCEKPVIRGGDACMATCAGTHSRMARLVLLRTKHLINNHVHDVHK